MEIRELEDDQDIEAIKKIVTDLSVDGKSVTEGFKDYPLENLDIYKSYILHSPLSFGAFENNTMIGFIVSYDVSNVLKIENTQDPILQHLLQKEYVEKKSVYIDILGIIQSKQNSGIGVRLLKNLIKKIKQQKFKDVRGVVCLDSHTKDNGLYKILASLGRKNFETIKDDKGNNFAIYKLDF